MRTALRQTWRRLLANRVEHLLLFGILTSTVVFASLAFAVVNRVLLRAPFPSGADVIAVGTPSGFSSIRLAALDKQDIDELRQSTGAISAAGFSIGFFEPRYEDADALRGVFVTPSFFELVGVGPTIGRRFMDDDETVADARPIVVSHDLWRSRFGSNPAVLNAPMSMGGQRVSVVGVMPPGFDFPNGANVWAVTVQRSMPFRFRYLTGLLRFQSGRLPAADAVLPTGMRAVPAVQYFAPAGHASIMVIFVCTTALIVMAWFHLAATHWGTLTERQREIGIRLSLGATRRRLAEQWLIEATVLAGVTGAGSALLLPSGVALLNRFLPPAMTAGHTIVLSIPVFLFTVGAIAITALVMVLTSVEISRQSGPSTLLSGHRGNRAIAERTVLRWGRLVLQCAVLSALVYVSVVGLRSATQALRADLGFNPRDLITVVLPSGSDRAATRAASDRLVERLSTLPGVIDVAHGPGPLVPGVMSVAVASDAAGITFTGGQLDRNARQRSVSGNYLRTVGIPIVEGRDFIPGVDPIGSVVLSRTVAERLQTAGSIIGRHVFIDGSARFQVVGIAGDVRSDGPDRPPVPMIYRLGSPEGSVVARLSREDPEGAAAAIRSIAEELRGGAGLIRVVYETTLHAELTALDSSRSLALLMTGVAAVVIGTAAIVSASRQTVRRRRREFAIRIALGAPPTSLATGIVGRLSLAAALGTALGIAAGTGLCSYLSETLFNVPAADARTMIAVFAGGLAAAALAAAHPARSVINTDPRTVLQDS